MKAPGGPWRRTIAAGAGVGVALLATAATTSSSGAQAAPTSFNNGTGSASAQSIRLNPVSGGLSFGIGIGEALAGHQNTVGTAESRSANLGVVGTTLAAEGCDGGEPTLPEDQQPGTLRTDSTEDGAAELSVGLAADGIAGRGVLLDVPRSRGVAWLEPGDSVTVDDVLAAERDQGVRIGRGDIVLVRVGHYRRRVERGPWDVAATRAGLHPEVVALLAEREVAVLGCDSNSDTGPSVVDDVAFPVHVLAINALGLMLLDYLQFEDLAPACAGSGRWSFLCVIAPLRLPTGTGSPVNPIAVL